jgi:hypothetical protein
MQHNCLSSLSPPCGVAAIAAASFSSNSSCSFRCFHFISLCCPLGSLGPQSPRPLSLAALCLQQVAATCRSFLGIVQRVPQLVGLGTESLEQSHLPVQQLFPPLLPYFLVFLWVMLLLLRLLPLSEPVSSSSSVQFLFLSANAVP